MISAGLTALLALRLGAAFQVQTPNFRVTSELPEELTLQAAQYLEELRAEFVSLGFLIPRLSLPRIDVLLLADVEAFNRYRRVQDDRARALFVPGTDRPFIVLAWDAPGDPWIALRHEYVHRVFSGRKLPHWLGEGLAEYLSRVRIEKGQVVMGVSVVPFVELLHNQPWVPLPQIWNAEKATPLVSHPNLRPQCWLLVHWLVSRGLDPRQIDYEEIVEKLRAQGPLAVEAELREFLERPPGEIALPLQSEQLAAGEFPVEVRALSAGELRLVAAEFLRETNQFAAARSELAELKQRFPDRPEPHESLGALEMHERNYRRAERELALAIGKGSQNPRTHYRYSLMLLRPLKDAARNRALRAVKYAMAARRLDPGRELYLLTEAQARMAAEQWAESARLLSKLAENPLWGERARSEFEELKRRQQQQLSALRQPVLKTVEGDPDWALLAVLPNRSLPTVSRPEPPPPPEPSSSPPWHKPGTILMWGHIHNVECRENEKIVTLRTPRRLYRFRERADAPAKLYFKPKWLKGLDCGTRGWEVNIVYKLKRGDPEVRGELVAVVF